MAASPAYSPALAALVLLLGLWFGYPLAIMARGERRGARAKPQGQSG